MSDLLELAGRLEKADGPDRELDGMIAEALSLYPDGMSRTSLLRQPELFSDGGPGLRARTWLAPNFTASLDAAMTLVPKGLLFLIANSGIDEIKADLTKASAVVGDPNATKALQPVQAASPALALCAAALRARAASGEKMG